MNAESLSREFVYAMQSSDESSAGRYYDAICRASRKQLINIFLRHGLLWEDAEEMTQHVFANVWERRHLLDPEQSVQGYIVNSAVNASLDYIRRCQRNGSMVALYPEMIDRMPVYEEDPFQALAGRERRRILDEAVASLPPVQKAIMTMRLDEMPIKDIASGMGITEGAVKASIYRAKINLRKRLLAEESVYF